jgi:hypothetical protein
MKWTSSLFASLAVVFVAACTGERRNTDSGAADNTGTETGTMQGGTTDTAIPSSSAVSDTAHGGARIHSDTNKPAPGTGAGYDSAGAPKGDSIRANLDTGSSSNR